MPKIPYKTTAFGAARLARIEQMDAIITEYTGQGYSLTLRQLYYQFVARGLIPNKFREYKNLGTLADDARMSGLIDWDAIVDRTRTSRALSHFTSPQDIIDATVPSYNLDRWLKQPRRCEVWIEKDALVGVVEGVCRQYDVPLLSCRGYVSQSTMWDAAQRAIAAFNWTQIGDEVAYEGQQTTIIHLGDHDPSGIDMSRDIEDRLAAFCRYDRVDPPVVERIALNYDQVLRYSPPPNPTKLTDSRAGGYLSVHGYQSWELDALQPQVLNDLCRRAIEGCIEDRDAWDATIAKQATERKMLKSASERWDEIAEMIGEED